MMAPIVVLAIFGGGPGREGSVFPRIATRDNARERSFGVRR